MPLRQIVCLSLAALSSTVSGRRDTNTPLETIIVTANRTPTAEQRWDKPGQHFLRRMLRLLIYSTAISCSIRFQAHGLAEETVRNR